MKLHHLVILWVALMYAAFMAWAVTTDADIEFYCERGWASRPMCEGYMSEKALYDEWVKMNKILETPKQKPPEPDKKPAPEPEKTK